MSITTLPLLDVFPVTIKNHTPWEKALARAGVQALREKVTYKNEIEMVKAVIEHKGLGESSSAMSDALKSSAIYSGWQRSMPYLRDVKNIHSYRNNNNHQHKINDVNSEITIFGGFFQKGQVLFRGGNFSECDFTISNGPTSTTTMPSVARWHGIKVHGDIAILKIAESNKIKAFVFKIGGYQRHTNEFEVLIQNNLKLKFADSFTHCKMKVVMYDVCIAKGNRGHSLTG